MKKVSWFFVMFFFAILAFGQGRVEVPLARSPKQLSHQGQVLVKVSSEAALEGFRVINRGRGALGDWAIVEESSVLNLAGVLSAETVPVVSIREKPNDRFFEDSWYYGGQNFGQGLPDIGWSQLDLEKVQQGASHGVLYFLDTGCPDSTVDDFEQSKIVYRASVINGSDPTDRNGHGTGTMGLIGAELNNAKLISGFAPKLRLGCVKATKDDGVGTAFDLANGVWSIVQHHNARKESDPLAWSVVNISLGGYGYSSLLQEVLDQAHEAGLLIFSAAGNDSLNIGPGKIPDLVASNQYTFSVCASGMRDDLMYWSNFGCQLMAPGVAISTLGLPKYGGYALTLGTSFASPLVAGTAALIKSAWPQATEQQVKIRLMAGDLVGQPTKVGLNTLAAEKVVTSKSRLNVARALREDSTPPTQPQVTVARVGSDSLDLSISSSDDAAIFGCQVLTAAQTFTSGAEPFVEVFDKGIMPYFGQGPVKATVPVTEGTPVVIAARCFDTAGNQSPLSDVATVATPTSKTFARFDGKSGEAFAEDGPTAGLFLQTYGIASEPLWHVRNGVWRASRPDVENISGLFGDRVLKFPVDLGQVLPDGSASLRLMLDNDMLPSYNFAEQANSNDGNMHNLFEVWVYTSNGTAYNLGEVLPTSEPSEMHFDLSPWAGQSISVGLRVYMDGTGQGRGVSLYWLAVTTN